MHIPLVLLLLSSSLSLSGAAAITETGIPLLWGHTISAPTEFEVIDGHLSPNPWHFVDRMSLYNVLITSTNGYMGPMGPGENQNLLWGLPLQLDWMFNSGRLADPRPGELCGKQIQGDTCVSPYSWYSCFNYFSSVLPFLSAAHKKIMGELLPIQMRTTAGAEGYCTTYDDCKTRYDDAMTKWDAFFQDLIDSSSSELPDNEKKDILLGRYWQANMASTGASTVCDQLLGSGYSAEEKAFSEGWKAAAEYVAAVNFHSSLSTAAVFMRPLPGRLLKEGDAPPNILDLTAEENQTLRAFSWMKSADFYLNGALVSMWRTAMCSAEARENGRNMLESMLTNSSFPLENLSNVVFSMNTCTTS